MDYNINLYFELSALESVLAAISQVSVYMSGESNVVQFADGHVYRLPFETHFDIPIVLEANKRFGFGACLRVPSDDVVEQYLAWRSQQKRDGEMTDKAVCVELWITPGEKYVEVQFQGAHPKVNEVLFASPAMHNLMLHILRQQNGLLGLLDDNTNDVLILGDLSASMPLKRSDYAEIDAFTTALLDHRPESE